MLLSDDIQETVTYHTSLRKNGRPTKGFRHISEIKYDDLTYRAKKHLEAHGQKDIFDKEIDVLGENILQSPLERALICFLRTEKYYDQLELCDIEICLPGEKNSLFERKDYAAAIYPQHQVGPYFLDFGLMIKCKQEVFKINVECDGKEFHSGSAEIINYDRRRDQYVERNGFLIWRISGKEINQNPLIATQKLTEKLGEVLKFKKAGH